jgi:hypothetical protein
MHPASSWALVSPCQQNSKPTRLARHDMALQGCTFGSFLCFFDIFCTFLQQWDSSCSVDDDHHRQTQIHVKSVK